MVEIITRVKQAGKRKDLIKDKRYKIPAQVETIEDIIGEIVKIDVAEFNENKGILKFLTKEEIEEKASIGKVDFGEKKNDNKQNLEDAIENAVLSFKDGIYLIFINGEQKENITENVSLTDGDEVLFIRLLMLAGRLW